MAKHPQELPTAATPHNGDAAEAADAWAMLSEAARVGERKARDFLLTFGPWAAEQVNNEPKS